MPPDTRLPDSFRIAPDRRSFRLDPRDESFYQDPYPTYAALHRDAPVAVWEEAGCLAVCPHTEVSRLLKSRSFGRVLSPDGSGRPDRSDVAPHLAGFQAIEDHSLLDLEAPAHTRLRALLTKSFTARRVEALAPEIAAVASALVDGFREAGEAEIVSRFAEPLPVAIIAALIGVPRADAADLLRWSHAMVAMYGFGRDRAAEDRAGAASREFADYLTRVVRERRARPGDDLASHLATVDAGDGPLREAEIVSLLALLLNAGHEATVHQIGNGLSAALGAGVDLAGLRPDDERTGRLVEEVLRFDTPLHLFRRFALADCEIAGQRLSAGDEVALMLGAANRDPRVYEEPDRFEPDRRSTPHVAFGAGIHFCIGAPLARLELRHAFATLGILPGLRLAGALRYRDSYHFRGVERLPVTFTAGGQSRTT